MATNLTTTRFAEVCDEDTYEIKFNVGYDTITTQMEQSTALNCSKVN